MKALVEHLCDGMKVVGPVGSKCPLCGRALGGDVT